MNLVYHSRRRSGVQRLRHQRRRQRRRQRATSWRSCGGSWRMRSLRWFQPRRCACWLARAEACCTGIWKCSARESSSAHASQAIDPQGRHHDCTQEAEAATAAAEEAQAALAAEQGRAFKLEAQVAELRQALSRSADLERELEVRVKV